MNYNKPSESPLLSKNTQECHRCANKLGGLSWCTEYRIEPPFECMSFTKVRDIASRAQSAVGQVT